MTAVSGVGVPVAFPVGGRRLVVYVVWDRRGGVEDYIPVALAGLREHADRILVVVNGELSAEGRAKLEPVCDEVLVRENRGFDIWAHKEALDHLGASVAEFDEVVFANDTWYGPVRPFGPVFERMDAQPVHFWGMTDHAREEPNPFTGSGVLPYHLQSFWIAVRREMLASSRWREYWAALPEMPGYFDAVLGHEVVFTEHFAEAGFVHQAAFPQEQFPSKNPSLYDAAALVADGCPLLKRRVFFQWPPYLNANGVVGRWVIDEAAAEGFPLEVMWRDLARNVAPKVLNADAGMLEVPASAGAGAYDPERALRVVAILHVFYTEMLDEMLDRVETLPAGFDLVVTTPDETRAETLSARLTERYGASVSWQVRVVDNSGRDQSAFLIGCRDILLGGEYDLVVKLHSKKTPQDGFNVGRHFAQQQFGNLLAGPAYTANVLAMFQREAGLGMVFPPMIHIGYPTMGRAWWANKPGFEVLADTLGIRVPLDDVSPLAPYGSMFIARPEALRLLVEHPWKYEDFGGEGAYADGGLAHILERMPAYAAGERGYHSRTVANADYLSLSYAVLEFNLDELSAGGRGDISERIQTLRLAGDFSRGRAADFLRVYLRVHHPGLGARLRAAAAAPTVGGRALRAARGLAGRARALRRGR